MTMFDFDLKWSESDQNDKKDQIQKLVAKTEFARTEFPIAVAKAGWSLLDKGKRPNPKAHKTTYVIGVSPVSSRDQQALGLLWQRLKDSNVTVYAFSFDDCSTLEELTQFAPSVIPVTEHPFIAEYLEGALIDQQQGAKVIEKIENIGKS